MTKEVNITASIKIEDVVKSRERPPPEKRWHIKDDRATKEYIVSGTQ